MPVSKLRNIGIIAHIDAGKTTTSERFLYYSGKIHRMGEVHDGDTVMDWRNDEQERGITIVAAATTLYWNDHTVNLIDTPGHVDFTAEVERSLRVMDGAVLVLCGVGGVEAQSETVWRQADRNDVPRLAFVNKLDRTGADFDQAVASIRTRLGANPIPIQAPWIEDETFVAIVDLVDMRLLRFVGDDGSDVVAEAIPAERRDEFDARRNAMIEALADVDDDIAEKFITEEEILHDDIVAAIRRVTLARLAVPVCAGSSLRNLGVQPLLDAVLAYLPAPSDLLPARGTDPVTGEVVERSAAVKEPFSGLVFKVQGQTGAELFYIRAYSGRLTTGTRLVNPRDKRKEKIHDLLRMHAKSSDRVESIEAGEIACVPGLKFTVTGDTLHDEKHPVAYESIRFPEPVVSLAVEAKSSSGREKLVDALDRMVREDPTFHWREDEETAQIILSGMGELHLEVVTNRLATEFRAEANIGKPRVTYREQVASAIESESEVDRFLGGKPVYGRVRVAVRPGDGFDATSDLDDDAPVGPAVRTRLLDHLRGELDGTGLYGYALHDVHARLVSVATRDVDPDGTGLVYAVTEAFQQALRDAGTHLLEPIMRIEITAPADYLGPVQRALQAKRAMIDEMTEEHGLSVVRGSVPMSEMFGFSGDLRTISQGRASFSMEPAGYAAVSDDVARRIIGS